MQPLRDIFYVRANKVDETKVKLAGGQELYIDPDFNKYHHAVQCGTIVKCPLKISEGQIYDVELKEGDRVYFHHFVVQDDNYDEINGEKLYRASYGQLFCVVRGEEILPLHDFLLAAPIKEDEENTKKKVGNIILYIKPTAEVVKNVAKVIHLSKTAVACGLQKGDLVSFMEDSDYTIKIEGTEYYRMSSTRINCTLHEA